MALADELAYITATELAARIRRRDLSPVEVVDAFIERIQARNPSLNALVYLGFDDARQRAGEAEQALVSGAELGVLHGVPTAIKDLFDFNPGWPATFGGIRALKDFTLDISCAFAERIQRAGAIVVGKTNSPIMGFRGTCDNYLFGPSRNPFGDRWGWVDPHPGLLVRCVRLQGLLWSHPLPQPAQRLLWRQPVPVRGADHQDGRGCRAGAGRPGWL
jgi:Asp-tRNA(Asn)/Glu-tRNA(Gln) amidotransferase A subunit family amidase